MSTRETLDLSHQTLLTEMFQNLSLDISEYSFPNLYLFRELHQYKLVHDDELFIEGMTREKEKFLMPTFALNSPESVEKCLKPLQEVDFLFPIPQEWLPQFNEKLFSFSFLESDSDYLFTLEKMKSYPGRHLSGKRNLVKQLLSDHDVKVVPYKSSHQAQALEILEKWQENQPLNKNQTDYESCKEAIILSEKLKLSGLIFMVDNQAEAFIFSEMFSRCCVIHFSKAAKNIKGLYQYLFQALANTLNHSISYMNLEQDLGSLPVRHAKHSYHPDKMIKKWRVSIK